MKKEIIWTVDLAQAEPEKQETVLKLAKQFAPIWNCKIRPVFVLNNSILHMDTDVFLRLQGIGKENLEDSLFEDFFGEDDDALLEDGELILSPSYTKRGLTQSLLEYAAEVNCPAIFCNTRTRSKHHPSFLGGFTESLLNSSTLPIVSIHPELDGDKKIKTILYASDLNTENDSHFMQVVELAAKFSAEIKLFFNPDGASNALYIAPQFPSQRAYQTILENDKKRKKEKEAIGRELCEKAGQKNVNCELVVASGNSLIDESILDYAEKNKVDLIAMCSQTPRLEGAVFGSIAKEVLRRAQCPVWALHT